MDFGSLLNQFQQDVKQHATSGDTRPRSPSDDENETKSRKKARQETDASSFPPVKEVYCLCPAGVQTGGPEALHQLCDQLNRSGKVSAHMLYVSSDGCSVSYASRAQKPQVYQSYDAPTVRWNALADDSPDQFFIWPECWTDEMLDYLDSGGRSQCAIWWLSVNNNTGRFQEWNRNDIVHLHQSEYARQHLKKHGVKYAWPMTEYIFEPSQELSKNTKRSIDVLYNPLKGMHYTDEILKRSGPSMVFRPIGGGSDGRVRISPQKVQQLLARAKVYMDFGPHPGMDRLPREAALVGCVVITNTEGAAQHEKDVPLPKRYKIESFKVDDIHKLLKDVLQNFQERSHDMDEYRTWIQGKKERMQTCVTSLLEKLVDERKPKKKKEAHGLYSTMGGSKS